MEKGEGKKKNGEGENIKWPKYQSFVLGASPLFPFSLLSLPDRTYLKVDGLSLWFHVAALQSLHTHRVPVTDCVGSSRLCCLSLLLSLGGRERTAGRTDLLFIRLMRDAHPGLSSWGRCTLVHTCKHVFLCVCMYVCTLLRLAWGTLLGSFLSWWWQSRFHQHLQCPSSPSRAIWGHPACFE